MSARGPLECTITGCTSAPNGRGLCRKHYRAWERENVAPRTASEIEVAFLSRIALDDGCLVWMGAINSSNGYGRIYVGPGRNIYAHRYAWERVHGSIPPGTVIDHACYNRQCVNVDHLRVASRRQNNENRSGERSSSTTSGVRGVYPARSGRWVARVGHRGKSRFLGTFDSIEEASVAAERARKTLFGEFAGRR